MVQRSLQTNVFVVPEPPMHEKARLFEPQASKKAASKKRTLSPIGGQARDEHNECYTEGT